jgi:hypothetical protein
MRPHTAQIASAAKGYAEVRYDNYTGASVAVSDLLDPAPGKKITVSV